MSMPVISMHPNPITMCQAVTDLLESIALEETALSHILNAEGEKLGKVAEEATKVEASETNGNIKVNGIEQVVYTEPADVVHGAIATEAEVNEMLNEVFAPQA